MLPNAIIWVLLAAAAVADSAGRYNSDLLPTNTNDLVVLPPATDTVIDVAIIIDGTEITPVSTPNYVTMPSEQEEATLVSVLSPPQAPLGRPTPPNPAPKSISISDAAIVTKPSETQTSGPAPAPTTKSYSTAKPKEPAYVGEKAGGPTQPPQQSAPAPSPSGGETYTIKKPVKVNNDETSYSAMKSVTDTVTQSPDYKPAAFAPNAAPNAASNSPAADASPNTPTAFPQSDEGFLRMGEYDASKQSPFMVADVYPKTSPTNYTVGPPPVTYQPSSLFKSGSYQAPKEAAKSSAAGNVSDVIMILMLVTALMFV